MALPITVKRTESARDPEGFAGAEYILINGAPFALDGDGSNMFCGENLLNGSATQ